MIWHQHLIHLSPLTLQNAYKYVKGIPNLSNFSFNDVKNCPTCINANMRKNSAGKQSLSKTVLHPYQGLFIDFGFSGKLSFDKEGKVKPGLREFLILDKSFGVLSLLISMMFLSFPPIWLVLSYKYYTNGLQKYKKKDWKQI